MLLTGTTSLLRYKGSPPRKLVDLNVVTIVPAGSAAAVPYMAYLARGRDEVKPACVALLDGPIEFSTGSATPHTTTGFAQRSALSTHGRGVVAVRRYPEPMPEQHDIEFEFVFEPQDEGGYHVYAPDLPGLHTQGEDIDDATENAREALVLYVEGLREEGRPVGSGVVRRRLAVPA